MRSITRWGHIIGAAACVVGLLAPGASGAPQGTEPDESCVQPPPPAWQPQPLTWLVSLDEASQQGTSTSGNPSVSADGRYVAFDGTGLTAGDTTGGTDVYVRDLKAPCGPRTILVSVASDGTQAGSLAVNPSISADGRYVAFSSPGAYVPEDTNRTTDVYVHDRDADADGIFDEPSAISTVWASIGPSGSGGGSPRLSGDGRYVAFSTGSSLVPEDQNFDYDAYVHDLLTDTTQLVSVALGGGAADGFSRAESISADGRYVSFRSDAEDILASGVDTNGANDVFVRDLQTQTTARVSVGGAGQEGDSWSGGSSLSADGRRLAFGSSASNLVTPSTTTVNIYVRDLDAQTTELVSVTPDGAEPNNPSTGARISADGTRVAFESDATDLVPFDFFPITDVFVRDLDDQLTVRASVSTTGGNPNDDSTVPVLTADGSRVVFASVASNIVAPDGNGDTRDVFIRTIPAELEPRDAAMKSREIRVGPGDDPRRMVTKFVEGSDIRLRRGRFVSDRYDLGHVNEAIARHGATPERLVKLDEDRVTALVRNAEALSGREHADFNLYFELHLPRDADPDTLLRELNGDPVVELAEPGATAVPASHEPTPSFIGEQGYRIGAPHGLDTTFANQLGGDGSGVGLVDIEQGWNLDHEELGLPQSTVLQIGGDAPSLDDDHGTAVLGVIVGKEGGPGISGMAPDTSVHVATPPVPNAILWAADHLIFDNLPADVILLEVAYPASNEPAPDLPVEIKQADRDAVALAVANGITVVEAAGNGNIDLDQYWDQSTQSHILQRSVNDTGAIFVGAGCPPSQHLPTTYDQCPDLTAIDEPGWWGSDFGSRLDVQGYGTGVRTLGYATPEGPCGPTEQCGFGKDAHADEPDRYYTGKFGGTSSASAVVAGAVSAAQSVHVAANVAPLNPASLRSLLVTTGTPQPSSDATSRPIGPRPDLGDALSEFMPWWWTHLDIPVEDCRSGPCGCPECVRVGEEVTWLINVARFGEETITAADVVDTLPTQVEFSSAEAPEGWTCFATQVRGGGDEVSCSTETMTSRTETLRITGTVLEGAEGELTNVVRSTAYADGASKSYELRSTVVVVG